MNLRCRRCRNDITDPYSSCPQCGNSPPHETTPDPPIEPRQGGPRGGIFDKIEVLPTIGKALAVGVIGAIGACIIGALFLGLSGKNSLVRELASIDAARGVITFIFAVGTMGIALMLTLGALLGNHPTEIFAKSKEVLTILIGVFGTILGFYFGSAHDEGANKPVVSAPAVESSADGKSVILRAYLSGGEPPYTYSIQFEKDALAAIEGKTTANGWIAENLDLQKIDPKKISANKLGYTISVTDARKKTAVYEAKEKDMISVKSSQQPPQQQPPPP